MPRFMLPDRLHYSAATAAIMLVLNAGQVQAQQTYQFSVPRGPLTAVITKIATTAGTSIAVPAKLAQGKTVGPVAGPMSVEQALAIALQGTGLVAVGIGNGGYAVKANGDAANATPKGDVAAIEVTDLNASAYADNGFQAGNAGDTVRLGDTPIKEMPLAVTAVTKDVLNSQGLRSAADAVWNVAGATVVDSGVPGGKSFTIRGFDTGGSTSVNGSFAGKLFSPPVDAIERIEVLKGPTSILTGSSAEGGLVNYVTKQANGEEIRELTTRYGSRAAMGLALDLGGMAPSVSGLAYRFVASGDKARDTEAGYLDPRNLYLAPSFKWTGENASVSGSLQYSNQSEVPTRIYSFLGAIRDVNGNLVGQQLMQTSRGIPLGNPDLNMRTETLIASTEQAYKIKDVFGNTDITFGNSITNMYQTSRNWNFALTNAVAGPLQDYQISYSYQVNDVQTIRPSITFASKFDTFNSTLKVGYDYRSMVGNASQANGMLTGTLDITQKNAIPLNMDLTLNPVGTNSVTSEGFYALEKLDLLDKKLHLLGSIRRDTATYNVSGGGFTDENMSGANSYIAGATYDLTPTTAPYVNYSKGIVLGYIDQFGIFVPPEGRELREAGIRQTFFDNKMSATVSVFQLTQTNTSFGIPGFTGIRYITTPGIESKGTELEVQGEVMEGWNVIGSLSKIDLTNLNSSNAGAQVNIAVPQWKGSIWSTYSFATQNVDKITFGAGVRAVSSSSTLVSFDAMQSTSFPVAGYGIVDAMIGLQKSNWDLQLKVNNVLNSTPIAPSKVGWLMAHEGERTWMFTARTKF